MAIYEYYCPTCRNKFEERRPMAQSTAVATCTAGHKAERTLSAFAAPQTGGDAEFEMEMGGGGGCCGGGGGCSCRSNN